MEDLLFTFKGRFLEVEYHFFGQEFYGEDAEEFNPERFLDGRVVPDQITYHPFGAGPRVCIGMRFAMTQMKIVLAKLLTTFRIVEENGVTNLEFSPGSIAILNHDKMEVRLEPRH